LIDVYGVLYNGEMVFDGALDLLKRIKDSGLRVLILSNTTFVSKACESRYLQFGLQKCVHYDEFLSSGEAFRSSISRHLIKAQSYYTIFKKNHEIFEGTSLHISEDIEGADFVYVGSPNFHGKFYTADDLRTKTNIRIKMEDMISVGCEHLYGFEQITETLNLCLRYNKTLVVVNPDIFALETVVVDGITNKRPILCQGAIGEFYEKLGGKVLYFGKPYPAIYDFARMYLGECTKTVMVGDTLWTDILGANLAKLDSVLVLTGICHEFFKTMDPSLDLQEKLDILTNKVALRMTHKSMSSQVARPTHLVESFA
jgi:HAD superfamily hydrolase (TIGR01450 family)